MLISLFGSALAFSVGTALSQDRLLGQQIDDDAQIVVDVLLRRMGDVSTAATLLAGDPSVSHAAQSGTEESLGILNERAVHVRNRFDVDLIQIYDRQGQARVNLVLSSLYRESSLIGLTVSGSSTVLDDGGRVLIVSQAAMPDDSGTVIVGIDLETELRRIVSQYRLGSDLGLASAGIQVGTRKDLVFDVPDGRHKGWYNRHVPVQLEGESFTLLLTRPTIGIEHITTVGLLVMSGSTLFTTLLLMGLGLVVTWLVVQPIRQLADAAEAVAHGDMYQQVDVGGLDEIGLLATAFNTMVTELRSLYGNLEAKVETRTHELKTSADIASAVSSSLELDVILQKTAKLIQRRLGFYYVGIYLVKPDSNVAVLHEATGKMGRTLKAQRFQVLVGSNCPVGIAAATGQPSVVHDVRAKSVYLKPPLLLDTYSAVAVPLLFGKTVIGIIDVQSRTRYAFTSEQIVLLVALASQIATGIHNAQLYDQQRDAIERLAEADRLKTQFLAIISHELRTPLNSIIGFSKVLLKGMDGPLTDAQTQDLTVIHEAGQHLLSLIQDVLDVSQINAGKMCLDLEDVELGGLTKNMLDAVQAMIQDKAVSLVADIDPTLPPVRADGRRLRQIMLNLLSNAAKFTDGGQITVRARVIEAFNPDTERMEPFVEVSVHDTGIGIPQDKIEDIFKEFTQVDASSTRRYAGAGLGLPITKKLVELHGGKIWVKSKVKQGTTFFFTLPLSQPVAQDVGPFEVVRTMQQEIDHA
jgi:signal transduction histidine kinase